jgi:hypothetical protein
VEREGFLNGNCDALCWAFKMTGTTERKEIMIKENTIFMGKNFIYEWKIIKKLPDLKECFSFRSGSDKFHVRLLEYFSIPLTI